MWVEDGDKQQQQQYRIDDIGKGVVKPIVEHEQHKAQADGGAYPHNLHARTCAQTENVGVAIVVLRRR